jgi:hypothetical protein
MLKLLRHVHRQRRPVDARRQASGPCPPSRSRSPVSGGTGLDVPRSQRQAYHVSGRLDSTGGPGPGLRASTVQAVASRRSPGVRMAAASHAP